MAATAARPPSRRDINALMPPRQPPLTKGRDRAGLQRGRSFADSEEHSPASLLPDEFIGWFARRGWAPRPHQLALIDQARRRASTLLIAPTGAGKTLSGFLPTLVSLAREGADRNRERRLHTLYISPLKALAVDVARNLTTPIAEMDLPIHCETRSGDTPAAKRQRQRRTPPDILMTTPEQLALLLGHEDAPHLFRDLDTIVLDELHTLAASKRGDLLALDIARLRRLAPRVMLFGLSATVARPAELRAYLAPQDDPDTLTALADIVEAPPSAAPRIEILDLEEHPVPWSGHSATYALDAIYRAIADHRLTLVFVNTRMQAELVFQELWRINDQALPIALHHGSLSKEQRRKVEAAMAKGSLKAVVATSTLDLGIDWGDVDLVLNIGAPKGASRLIQRVGRSNHRLDEPSKALLVPANRFEVLECRAALEAAAAGEQDAIVDRQGGLDVLAQHVLGMACQAPLHLDGFYEEIRTALPYSQLTRTRFDRVVEFVSTGGYALRAYDRFARLRPLDDGRLRLAHPRIASQYRLNVGTIVEGPVIKVRLIGERRRARAKGAGLAGGRVLGEVDEYFIEQLAPGDTFVFAGEVLCFEGLSETEAFVSRAANRDPMVPSYSGGKFPLSTHLARRVRQMLANPGAWRELPRQVSDWLALHSRHSLLPEENEVLVETFPRGGRHYLVLYPFEGRLAHQTLGMLLTRRLERRGARPLGFVANDYGLAVWAAADLSDLLERGQLRLDMLLEEDILGDDLDAWLAESSLMKRTFRNVAVIAGLIERRHPGREKSGRQVTMSTDLIYDVLRKHEPGHILLEAAWADAATGLLDVRRLGEFLARIKGRIRHRALLRVSPLSVPILLEIGREPVGRLAREDLLRDAAEALIREATTRDGNDSPLGDRAALGAHVRDTGHNGTGAPEARKAQRR